MVQIAVVAGWQTVNIGDVAHSPGTLEAFRRFAPEARLTLWARNIDTGVRRLISRYFPDVEVVDDKLAPDGTPTPAVERLFAEADLLVHGSGPSLVAQAEVAAWRRHAGKPYGFFGITVDPLRPYHATLDRSATMIDALRGDLLTPVERELLHDAAFVYCRDSLTERFLNGQGLPVPELAFGPDATVIFDLADDEHATKILQTYGLVPGRFLCAVPRLRYTPYYRIRGHAPRAEDLRRDAYNEGYVESDLAVLRQGIVDWVRQTGMPALVVPEMTYEVELAEQRLAGTFPEDVAGQVHVLPRFWDVTEASAVYRHAAAVLSMECHSPLLALAEGVPALYLRQPTDTIKGRMCADLDRQVVELASPTATGDVTDWVARTHADLPAARAATDQARARAHDRLREMVAKALEAVAEKVG
ncbi:polysaccharide pyruvyl transferase family protein [Tenggerimyces flavus]|uniref:Polysaccharide pyruvyl transferase family protein n=1 Tax=Tenggerimyces flavus TaxID=1708749 RepID=A0ABV7YKY2_9ACTN|nr:polysaccharide pyruvyl transferase family protein [Tenggerimyces flavus]MBM7784812.1 hypothetical protein [Tenggerimyces flavus]